VGRHACCATRRLITVFPCLKQGDHDDDQSISVFLRLRLRHVTETICSPFVDRMTELDHAESTVKLYLSCINDVAKAMATAGNAACDLDEKRALELVAAMGWINPARPMQGS
jgi:hypothetical protein